MWNERYKLNISMIPTLVSSELAEQILLTGKSVNFLKRCCKVNDWHLNLAFIDVESVLSA